MGRTDYIFRADLVERQEHLIGGFASLMLLCSLLVVLSPVGRQSLQWRDVQTVLPLTFLGVFLGAAYRVTTAAVVGANIGGGLAFLFGIAFVPSMLILAFMHYRQPPASD